MRRCSLLILLLTLSTCLSIDVSAEETSYPDLVARMIDLERLAVLPQMSERCAQWSSFDRRSRFDADTGKYVDWHANGDGTGFIRKEGESLVLAEMDGPGCIWRIWSARPQKGHVKIYLDGAETPAVDLPFEDYFKGTVAPFDYRTLSYALEEQGCRGMNLYFPIPYQKSCKVVAEPGWGRYYHFTYATFPKETQLPTFRSDMPDDWKAALTRVDTFFREHIGDVPTGEEPNGQSISRQISVAPKSVGTVAKVDGPRAITSIRVKLKTADRADEIAALRKLVLRITWDDQKTPAVWCPLGDFFGTAPGINEYRSLTTGMVPEGFYVHWYMPFEKSATIELVNDEDTARNVVFEIRHTTLTRPFGELGHFHCKWHRDVFPVSEDRYPDWTLLKTEGRGRFCGVMLHVWNPRGGQYAPAGEGRYWWGEGDEKFFVDGEKFPSTFGTGSEDYFGYAWGNGSLFQTPYHCQTMTEQNHGHQSVLRWHIADAIPFQKSFEGAIEKYFPNSVPTLFAATVCWYVSPDGVDPHEACPVEQRHGYWVRPPLETGGVRVSEPVQGRVQIQQLSQYKAGKWENNDHLWWTNGKPGDTLNLLFSVEKAGTYDLSAILTKARDYGVVQLSVDGKNAGDPIDLFNPEVINTEPISLGTFSFTSGEHTLAVKIVGANEKAVKSYMFGIDRLLFSKTKGNLK